MEWYKDLSGSFFGILYLYLWYSHTILFSNGCVGGINPCDLFSDCIYCFQSHLSLSIRMVTRCFPVSLYMYAIEFCVCMICVSILISFLELHSFVEICTSGMINGKGTYLMSLFCFGVKFAFIMLL